jgi:hypothetical protein
VARHNAETGGGGGVKLEGFVEEGEVKDDGIVLSDPDVVHHHGLSQRYGDGVGEFAIAVD